MNPDGSVTRWIAELELGRVDEAEEELWQRYFQRLVGLAQLNLEVAHRSTDEEDVANAALQSFFSGVAGGRFPRLHNRNDLWPVLAKIASRKALERQRYLSAEQRKCDTNPDDSNGTNDAEPLAASPESLVERELGPEYLAIVSEECGRLFAELPDDQLRLIARRRLEGCTNAEIALELGVIEHTVERRLRLICSIWG